MTNEFGNWQIPFSKVSFINGIMTVSAPKEFKLTAAWCGLRNHRCLLEVYVATHGITIHC